MLLEKPGQKLLYQLVPIHVILRPIKSNYLDSTVYNLYETLHFSFQDSEELGYVPLGHLPVVAEEGHQRGAVASC